MNISQVDMCIEEFYNLITKCTHDFWNDKFVQIPIYNNGWQTEQKQLQQKNTWKILDKYILLKSNSMHSKHI